jgi:hypothetical protein
MRPYNPLGHLPRHCFLIAALISLTATPLLARSAETPLPTPEPISRVEIERGKTPGLIGLHLENAPLGEVAAALERELACEIDLPGKLSELRLTADFSPRPPERLFPALARRANCRLQGLFHLGKAPTGTSYLRRGTLLSEGPAPVSLPRSLDAEAALALLRSGGVAVETEINAPLSGVVRFPRNGTPLRFTLDAIARATRLTWWPKVRLEPRKSVDAAAEEEDRRQAHYTDLVALTSEERREEIAADLSRLDDLSDAARESALSRIVGDLQGLGTLFERTPGEHRDGIRANLMGIGGDYRAVLSGLRSERQSEFGSLLAALRELGARLQPNR